jgi:hypothetical protein
MGLRAGRAAIIPIWNERFDLAIAMCDAGLERAAARGSIGPAVGFRQWRSIAELWQGAVADALADASAAHDYMGKFSVKGRATIACLTDALIAHGDLDAAEAIHAGVPLAMFRGAKRVRLQVDVSDNFSDATATSKLLRLPAR